MGILDSYQSIDPAFPGGGLSDYLSDEGGLFGQDTDIYSLPTVSPEQQEVINQLASLAGDQLPGLLGQLSQVGRGGTQEGLASVLGSSYEATDPELLRTGFAQIEARTKSQIEGALGSRERFSSGNQLLRGRLALEGERSKSSHLAQIAERERQDRIRTGEQYAQRLQQASESQLQRQLQSNLGFEQLQLQGLLGASGGLLGALTAGTQENVITTDEGLL